MQLRRNALATVALLACGAPADEASLESDFIEVDDGELGSLQQALTWPDGYGTLPATAERCFGDPASQGCIRPADKTIRVKFFASTCSSWWQGRVFTAHAYWSGSLGSRGWTITGEVAGQHDYAIRCGEATGLGHFAAKTTKLPDGSRIFQKGDLYLDTAQIEGLPSWQGKTDEQRQKFGENVARHELMHGGGLGHQDAVGPLMGYTFADPAWYNYLQNISVLEAGWLQSYTP